MSEHGEAKSDADLIHDTYKTKLMELDESESKVKDELVSRLNELDNQEKAVKVILFDAKVQHRSDEISDAASESIQIKGARRDFRYNIPLGCLRNYRRKQTSSDRHRSS